MAYTNSPLVSVTKLSPNHSGQRTHAIDTVTIHCVVGQCSAERIGEIFAPVTRQASSNYGIGYDGKIGMYVEEKNRSWCTSSNANDQRAITIEVASDTTHPYAVNAKAYAALLDLVTDICKRNGIKKLVWSTNKNERVNHLNGCNMTVHRDYANKSCPGDYLYNRHGEIAAEVNKRLNATDGGSAGGTTPPPALTFNKGDIVNFSGNKHYSSSNATSAASCKPGVAKITATAKGAKHPYHLIYVSGGGSNVYGWVDANTITLKTSNGGGGSTAPISLTAGTKLNLQGVALYGSSAATTKAGTKTGTYYVWSKDVINGKIRITNSTSNVGKAGQVTGWITEADAKKSAGGSTSAPSFTPYKVKITADVLNIRKGAGTNYAIAGQIRDKGVYTIVGEATGRGATKWLKLKSGAGFIASDFTKRI